MKPCRAALLPVLLSIFATASLAQSVPSVSAIMQSDGTFKALSESQPIVTGQFTLYKENWSRVQDWSTTGNGATTFSRSGQLGPGLINVQSLFSNSSGSTNLTFKATPTRDLQSMSDHVNLMLDDAFWAGATLNGGGQNVLLNPNFTQSFAVPGSGNVITVTRADGFKMTITAPQSVNFVIIDSRQYHLGFELRFDERNGAWTSGTTRTYNLNISFSNSISTTADTPISINASANWKPLVQSMSVLPGSALDWSDSFVSAAGSKGWLKVNPSDKFSFESTPTKREKFYGANLAHYACFPDHTQAVQLADNLARAGYNTVRLHHIDYILTDPTPGNSTTIDPAWMDKLNFLIAKLKERGMYISIDLFSNRKPRDNEVIGGGIGVNDFKALLLVSPTARQNWLTYSTNLLNTVNPYTGLAWKDDPAIAWIDLVNENTPFWMQWPRSDIKSMLDSAVGGDWAAMSGQGARNAVNLSNQTSTWMTSQLRSLGVKALITDINAGFNRALSIGRNNLDYVDNHMYYAHPDNFGTPLTQKAVSPLKKVEEIGWFAASRIAGKPFTVSEFDAVAPNQFRAEYGLMVGAMGVVQNWDGMWRFQWADNMDRALTPQAMGLFSLAGDPLNMATERAIVAMFLRGDLSNSDTPYQIPNPLGSADENEIRTDPVVIQSILGKPFNQTTQATGPSAVQVVVDGQSITNDGAVKADLNKLSLQIKTTCSAAVIGSEGQTVNSGILTATFTKSRASIYLTSVDKKPLSTSRRMLLAHLTDVQNTGATFSGQERTTLTNWGDLPYLAKVGGADISIQLSSPSNIKIYRLDLSGKRVGTVNFTKTSTGLKFTAATTDPASGNATLYYELVRIR